MKKNLSSVTLTAPVLSVRGVNGVASPQNKKKVEGFDKTSMSQTFASKIEKIRDKPKKETLQGAYVSGLQDEIHYLQMQLKLLKDKEIAKRSQVDQLQTFFGDGIPINQNILALKNGFNNYKSQLDKKICSLQTQKQERQNIIVCLRAKVAESVKKVHLQQKKYKQLLTSKSNITHEKIKKECQIKHQIDVEEQNLKAIKAENRKISENITGMQRNKQLNLVTLMKIQNTKYNKLNKLRESVAEKQKQFQELAKVYQQLKKQEDQKSYVINLQQSNVTMKRKIISLQKEFHALTIKIQEKEMQLQAKLKQRHKQIIARVDIQKRVDAVKQAIQRQNNMSVEELDKIAMERQAKILENIQDRNKKLNQYVQHYGNLLYKVEEHIYQMGERKPELKRELQIYQNQFKGLQKTLEEQKNKHCELTSEIAKLTSKGHHMNTIAPPTIKQITLQKDKITACKAQRERLIKDIQLKQKQLELMQILKCLNLQETEISNSSNSSLQDRIIDFMQNWDALNQNQ